MILKTGNRMPVLLRPERHRLAGFLRAKTGNLAAAKTGNPLTSNTSARRIPPNHLNRTIEEPTEGESLSPPSDLFQPDAPSEHAPIKQRPGASVTADAFARFWAVYPRRAAKGAARKALAKAIKAGADPEAIIEGARRYGAETGRRGRAIHGAPGNLAQCRKMAG